MGCTSSTSGGALSPQPTPTRQSPLPRVTSSFAVTEIDVSTPTPLSSATSKEPTKEPVKNKPVAVSSSQPTPIPASMVVVAAPPKVARPKDSLQSLSRAEAMIPRGDFLDAYQLGDQIGKGNYSVVYDARARKSNLLVAVKIVDKTGLDHTDVRDIKEEVSILEELRHGHVVSLMGFFEDKEYYYIVTEMMSGGELFEEIVEREFYFERDAQEVIKTLAGALGFMHEKGIVHRDLKPENVLLTSKGKDGVVKLADFGFAARTDPIVNEYQLTTPCGTPGYVAPEIVSGLKYGKEVDMWSLGVIAFILLGGYPPFHDDDQQELFRLIRRGKFSFDPTYWEFVSEEAKSCVRALLTVDRSKRLKAFDVRNHSWIKNIPDDGNQGGGVGGRGMGQDGRGPEGSVNLSPALRELKKFQARRRWKDGMAIALAREGQVFGNLGLTAESATSLPSKVIRLPDEDITRLGGLGSSNVLERLQKEKRQRAPGGF